MYWQQQWTALKQQWTKHPPLLTWVKCIQSSKLNEASKPVIFSSNSKILPSGCLYYQNCDEEDASDLTLWLFSHLVLRSVLEVLMGGDVARLLSHLHVCCPTVTSVLPVSFFLCHNSSARCLFSVGLCVSRILFVYSIVMFSCFALSQYWLSVRDYPL